MSFENAQAPVKEKDEQETKWKHGGLMRAIKEVEMAKKKDPDAYAKALAELKEEAGHIGSIEELKAVAKKKREKDMEDG